MHGREEAEVVTSGRAGGIAQLESDLLRHLADALREDGFDKRKAQSFYMKTATGRAAFHIAFIKHATDIDLTADVAVRNDAVEELFGQIMSVPEKENRDSFTLGCELGNLTEGRPRRWTAAAPADIPGVVDSLALASKTIVIPYIQRYGDPGNALEVLSRNDELGWLHSPLHGKRCCRAVVLAVISGVDATSMSTLRRANEHFLRSRTGPQAADDLKLFLDFCRRLDEHSNS